MGLLRCVFVCDHTNSDRGAKSRTDALRALPGTDAMPGDYRPQRTRAGLHIVARGDVVPARSARSVASNAEQADAGSDRLGAELYGVVRGDADRCALHPGGFLMSSAKRSNEPIVWFLFGVGGFVA